MSSNPIDGSKEMCGQINAFVLPTRPRIRIMAVSSVARAYGPLKGREKPTIRLIILVCVSLVPGAMKSPILRNPRSKIVDPRAPQKCTKEIPQWGNY